MRLIIPKNWTWVQLPVIFNRFLGLHMQFVGQSEGVWGLRLDLLAL